ncbi:MAG: hypothetical protein FPO08_16200 [Geobacter sp.]|nr:MAG: hypothetical protein FPO08_16200 [Geobacter sp.]
MASYQILKQKVIVLLCLIMILLSSGCVTYFGYDGPYEGKVIDKDTRQPIEGAVVHGTWVKSIPGPGGASSSYYDSREVLTDKNGNFKIEGVGLLIFSNMEEMEVNVFKAGYEQWQSYWSSPKRSKISAQYVEWEGNKAIFKLRRMTFEERKNRVVSSPSTVGSKQGNAGIRLFLLEENKENIELGYPSSTIHKVD